MEELSPVKKALLEVRSLRARLHLLEKRRSEPIAITGLGLRLPGGVDSPEEFWELLRSGGDAVTEVPPARWDNGRFFDPDFRTPGKVSTPYGSFLKDVDQFDAAFFGISPREAENMDPQHRLLLEVTWEALERAGQAPAGLMGSNTGVFVGISNSDYQRLLLSDLASIDPYVATGNLFSLAAGRLAYTLGLHGPNVAVDTACSSSLVAVHQAVQSLRQGECDLALAGGVSLMLSPAISVNFSKAQMMAADGRCKTFDAAADGYVRGEGCIVIVLKRLAEAVEQGDPVLAVIRGSAINHDGRSGGLTAPNGPAQTAVIRAALANAGVQAQQIGYVETHGTGTALGDPIEVQALVDALAQERAAGNPLRIGSVKTNLGHLEAAAGLAGLLKGVLCLQHKQIPPHLHLRTLNPHIDWGDAPVEIPTQLTAWEVEQGSAAVRMAGVSAFGLSGTNAHVILQEAPAPTAVQAPTGDRQAHVLCLAAMTPHALQEMIGRYEDYFQAAPAHALADIAYTANVGRSHFNHRLALVAGSTAEMHAKLAAYGAGRHPHGVFAGHVKGVQPPVTFLYSGHGANYVDMGRQLYTSSAIFRSALDECNDLARPLLEHPLLSVLYPGLYGVAPDLAAPLEQMTYAQVALFALQYGLTKLWRSWGIEPAVVMGHSAGEYAAAAAAGVFSLADGLKLAAVRGQLLQAAGQAPGHDDAKGMMAAVFADAKRVEPYLGPYASQVAVAAYNGPANVVISGHAAAVEQVLRELRAANIKARPLPIAQAAHSPLLDPLLPQFEATVAGIAAGWDRRPLSVALVSSVTGELAGADQVTRAAYWRDHLRQPVRFQQAMATLHGLGQQIFIEVGPRPMLLALGERCLPSGAGVWVPSLRESGGDWQQMMESLAMLYVNGVAPDWQAVHGEGQPQRAVLPTYPFQRKRYWTGVQFEGSGQVPRRTTEEVWQAVCAAGQHQAGQVPLDLAVQQYPAKWEALRELVCGYIAAALRELGAYHDAGEAYTAAEFGARFGVLPAYTGLVERWCGRLVEEGLLAHDGERFVAHQALGVPDLEARRATARAALVDAPMIFDYVERCGGRLAGVVTGTVSALDTLFPGGSPALAEALYQDWAVSRYYANLMRSAVQGYVSLRGGDSLQILEVGAGTGATTAALLPILPPQSHYEFTDVSDLFLGRAATKFAAYPFVRYARLDIEQAPAAQGYAGRTFDVIVAVNVLHAAADLHAALDHLYTLLAPGGVLLLGEATEPLAWFDITTALIEGWQRFDDDLRREQPLLPAQAWERALRAHNFVEVAAWPLPGTPAEVLGQHVIAALKGGDAVPQRLGQAAGRVSGQDDPTRGAASEPIADTAADAAAVKSRLLAAVPDERRALVFELVCSKVRSVLRLEDDAPLDETQRLLDLGLDSLMALELRRLLAYALDLGEERVSATLVFDYPTIGAIVGYLEGLVLSAQPAAAAAVPAPGEPADRGHQKNGHADRLAEVSAMSDADVEALLLAKLNRR